MSEAINLKGNYNMESNCEDAIIYEMSTAYPVNKQEEISTKVVLSLTLDEDEQDFE